MLKLNSHYVHRLIHLFNSVFYYQPHRFIHSLDFMLVTFCVHWLIIRIPTRLIFVTFQPYESGLFLIPFSIKATSHIILWPFGEDFSNNCLYKSYFIVTFCWVFFALVETNCLRFFLPFIYFHKLLATQECQTLFLLCWQKWTRPVKSKILLYSLISNFTFIDVIWCKQRRKLQIYRNTKFVIRPILCACKKPNGQNDLCAQTLYARTKGNIPVYLSTQT